MNKNILKDIGIVLICMLFVGVLSVAIVLGVTQWVTDRNDFMQSSRSFQAIATVVLICVGGIFAYRRLQLFRSFEPHLTISHEAAHRNIGDSYVHIDVKATLHNGSKVQVELRDGFFVVLQISPSTDEEIEALYSQTYTDEEPEDIQWPTLDRSRRSWNKGELIIEPGASHPETYEFILLKDVETVLIYTYFYDPRFSRDATSPRGWVATTVYDIVKCD